MQAHPSYPVLSGHLKKYPSAASSLFQAYNDITYAQQWVDLSLLDLGEEFKRVAIKGRRKMGAEDGGGISEDFSYVFPCSLSEAIPYESLQKVLPFLGAETMFMAITSEDASIVYYKISAGIVKPAL